jgi:histidinol-phosphate aminotransferase
MRSHLSGTALYPDGAGYALRHRLAQRHGVGPEQITLGNGSNDVLDLVARVFAGPGREVVFSQYAFAVYPLVTLAVSATPVEVPARGFGHDLNAMRARVDERTAVVFIANPNNPTGTWLRTDELDGFVRNLPGHVLVVVDEAYFEYVQEPDYPDAATWVARYPNLIVTRTFSKAHGLAGLRVGYAVSHPEVADLLNRVRQPFNVNTLAQVAALAALDDGDHVRRAREVNRAGMRQLREALDRLELEYIHSVGNFLCVDMGGPAIEVYERLLREGVIARPLAGYGLPRHLRVTVGRESENARFVAALQRLLGPAA